MIESIQDDRTTEAPTVRDLATLEHRIEHHMKERGSLAAAFDALAGRIRTALADGRLPLAQIAELDELNRRIEYLEEDLCSKLEQAGKKFLGAPKL